jgi:uncharacterized radical SAM superfamily protein
MLISGGCDLKGRIINLENMLDVLHRVKMRQKLIVAIHPGLISQRTASELAGACHVAFADIVGDETTANQIIGTGSVDEYAATIQWLIGAGIPVTPHLTVGLHHGKIVGEYRALRLLDPYPIQKIVINIICSTTGTEFAHLAPPDVNSMRSIIVECIQRGWQPVLGCMRPRGRPDFERTAIDAGVKDIALPSKTTLNYVKSRENEVEMLPACCGLPNEMISTIRERM